MRLERRAPYCAFPGTEKLQFIAVSEQERALEFKRAFCGAFMKGDDIGIAAAVKAYLDVFIELYKKGALISCADGRSMMSGPLKSLVSLSGAMKELAEDPFAGFAVSTTCATSSLKNGLEAVGKALASLLGQKPSGKKGSGKLSLLALGALALLATAPPVRRAVAGALKSVVGAGRRLVGGVLRISGAGTAVPLLAVAALAVIDAALALNLYETDEFARAVSLGGFIVPMLAVERSDVYAPSLIDQALTDLSSFISLLGKSGDEEHRKLLSGLEELAGKLKALKSSGACSSVRDLSSNLSCLHEAKRVVMSVSVSIATSGRENVKQGAEQGGSLFTQVGDALTNAAKSIASGEPPGVPLPSGVDLEQYALPIALGALGALVLVILIERLAERAVDEAIEVADEVLGEL